MIRHLLVHYQSSNTFATAASIKYGVKVVLKKAELILHISVIPLHRMKLINTESKSLPKKCNNYLIRSVRPTNVEQGTDFFGTGAAAIDIFSNRVFWRLIE